MLLRHKIAVCSGTHMKPSDVLCEQISNFLMLNMVAHTAATVLKQMTDLRILLTLPESR
jgi:hypothetical protein